MIGCCAKIEQLRLESIKTKKLLCLTTVLSNYYFSIVTKCRNKKRKKWYLIIIIIPIIIILFFFFFTHVSFNLTTIETNSFNRFLQSRTLFRFRGCRSCGIRIRRWHGLKNRGSSRTKAVPDVLLTISRGQGWAKFCEHVMPTDRGNWFTGWVSYRLEA